MLLPDSGVRAGTTALQVGVSFLVVCGRGIDVRAGTTALQVGVSLFLAAGGTPASQVAVAIRVVW